jgi:signal transduction histidine kinase
MSAVLAHEIRNPLGTIKGFAQLAIEQGGVALQPLLAPVVDQAKRLAALVNDLLVYGRPPSPNFETVRWAEMAARLDGAGRQLAAGRNTEIEITAGDIALETDPNLLEQILVNLLRNALDAVAGQPDGQVRMIAEANGNAIRILVSDNGPGIAKEHREKITQPFFTTKAFGTGLGLPISIRLAESLHGGLEVGAGKSSGTIATVWLPLKRKRNGTDSDRG